MIRFAAAGERVYGTRTNQRGKIEDYHCCTVRHDIFLGELPDFPACLGDWQQANPPMARHFIREAVNVYTTRTETRTVGDVINWAFTTSTATVTNTNMVDLASHGGGQPAEFGVPWNGESWWRPYEHDVGGERASLHYDLRFRSPSGTCTWRMDELNGTAK